MCWDENLSSQLNYRSKKRKYPVVTQENRLNGDNYVPRMADLASLSGEHGITRRAGLTNRNTLAFDLSGPRAQFLWRLDSEILFFSLRNSQNLCTSRSGFRAHNQCVLQTFWYL